MKALKTKLLKSPNKEARILEIRALAHRLIHKLSEDEIRNLFGVLFTRDEKGNEYLTVCYPKDKIDECC